MDIDQTRLDAIIYKTRPDAVRKIFRRVPTRLYTKAQLRAVGEEILKRIWMRFYLKSRLDAIRENFQMRLDAILYITAFARGS